MLRNIDINFEKFIKYSSRLNASYHTNVVLKKSSLNDNRRKFILGKNFGLHKIDSKGKGR